DIDGDGNLDVVTSDTGSRSVHVGFLDSKGRFSELLSAPVSHEIRDLASGDLDGDGRADIAIVGDVVGSLTVLRSTGRDFELQSRTSTPGAAPHAVRIGDFNGDTHQDLAVWGRNDQAPYLTIYEGRGAFEYAEKVVWDTHLNPTGVSALLAALTWRADKATNDSLVLFPSSKDPQVVAFDGESYSILSWHWPLRHLRGVA